jgi:tripartite-type tricarboxylate transporter receptor subunit TctC
MNGKGTTLKKHDFRKVTVLCVLMAFSALFPLAAAHAADSYPSKPIRLIVPFAPGGTNDIIGRLIATKLTERLGKSVVVENHAGAGAIIGTEMVAKADPDGYTLLVAAGSHTTNPALQKVPYDPIKSFTPIARLATGPFGLVVNANLPANSIKELIALAKQKPGQLIFASTGVATTPHMTIELFRIMADIDIKVVQFKGGAPSITDVLGGHSHALIGSLVQVMAQVKAGKLKVLGTGGATRSVILPDVPTIAEAGLPGYQATNWYGILAPAGVPTPIVDRLTRELKAILASEEVKKVFLNDGAEAAYAGPSEFGPFLEDELVKWVRVVKQANIKLAE